MPSVLREEAMVDCDHARRGAVRRVDLRVDVLDVVRGGLRRDGEPLRDLPPREAAREPLEHLALSTRESGRALAALAPAVTGCPENCLDGVAVVPAGRDLGTQHP